MLLRGETLNFFVCSLRYLFDAKFTQTRAFSKISFVQFRPYTNLFPGLLLSLMLTSKNKKTLEMSLDLIPLLKISVDIRVEGHVSNVYYLENWHCNFIQRKYGRKKVYCAHSFCSVDCNFSFFMDFLHHWWLLKVKKE